MWGRLRHPHTPRCSAARLRLAAFNLPPPARVSHSRASALRASVSRSMRLAPVRPKGLPSSKSKGVAKEKNRLPSRMRVRQNVPLRKKRQHQGNPSSSFRRKPAARFRKMPAATTTVRQADYLGEIMFMLTGLIIRCRLLIRWGWRVKARLVLMGQPGPLWVSQMCRPKLRSKLPKFYRGESMQLLRCAKEMTISPVVRQKELNVI